MSAMSSFFSSPRRRRRVALGAGAMLAVVLAVIGIKAMPDPQKLPPDTWGKQQAIDVSRGDEPIKVTRTIRRQISEALDQFVPTAVARHHPEKAYAAATPNLRSQATVAQWRAGDIPVQPFPLRHGQSYHGWTVNFAFQNQVNLDLLVMPDLRKETHPLALTIDMRKVGGHWLVDSVFPVAVFAPLPKQGNRGPMVSTYDLVPGQAAAGGRSRVSYGWFLVPFALVGGALLLIVGLGVRGVIRDRRARSDHRPLPPLPTSRAE
jgi:hypothetical protein